LNNNRSSLYIRPEKYCKCKCASVSLAILGIELIDNAIPENKTKDKK
jgi:hypothetical protein